jgi:hypothetical protein
MGRYRQKPVVVEAEQFWPDTRPWPEGVYAKVVTAADFGRGQKHTVHRIDTLKGTCKVDPGDWIIKGGRKPCKPDIFEATYEAVEAAVATQEG